MGSSSRWWLNHDTHSSVASSTVSQVFHGARRWIISALESVDRLGQRVVVAVALTADRGLDAGLGQSLAVADRDVLGPAIRVVDERAVAFGLAVAEACSSASSTKSVCMERLTRQPTMQRARRRR